METIDKNKSGQFNRLYRGAYNYYHDSVPYTEETFQVFREKKELRFHYDSEVITRVASGEILKINVNYVITKDWLPNFVQISKSLGTNYVVEKFSYNPRKNFLRYTFESTHDKKDDTFTTPPRFSIQTPSVASSMIFLNSKKIDQTARNYFHVFYSQNEWRYEDKIKSKNHVLERAKIGEVDTIKVGTANLQAIEYVMSQEEVLDDKKKEQKDPSLKGDEASGLKQNSLVIYMSKHMSIPYKIIQNPNTYIEIKYLNDFTENDSSEEVF